MKKLCLLGTVCAYCFTFTGNSWAATFDFSSFESGFQGTTTLSLPEADFTSLGDDIFLNQATTSDICAINGGTTGSCNTDLNVEFNGLASAITFDVFGWASGDTILVSLFDAGDNLLASNTILANGVYSFASTGVASILFDDSSTAAGVAYGNWSFELTQVPLPAAVWLFGSGLLGLIGISIRKKVS